MTDSTAVPTKCSFCKNDINKEIFWVSFNNKGYIPFCSKCIEQYIQESNAYPVSLEYKFTEENED